MTSTNREVSLLHYKRSLCRVSHRKQKFAAAFGKVIWNGIRTRTVIELESECGFDFGGNFDQLERREIYEHPACFRDCADSTVGHACDLILANG